MFLSYAADDAAWATTLAEQLKGHGLSPFLVEWSVEPGQVTLLRSEAELAASRHGIAVISPASLRDARAMDEYAALATASAARGLRFIPVLLGHVPVPPFAAHRVWRDFSDASGPECPEFAGKVAELAAVIAGRPAPEGGTPSPDNLAAAHPSPPRPVTAPEEPAFVVCHAPADAVYGRSLAGQLRAAGLPVWSTGDLRPGDAQFWTIRQQLRHALAVVVVMSPQSQESEDITRMILEGQVHGRTFLPVLLDGAVNYHLAATWHLDARDGQLLDETELDLLRRMHADLRQGRPVRLPEARRVPSAPVVRLPAPAALERLRDHLADDEYEHADLLTTRLVLEAAGRLTEGWLSERHAAAVGLDLLSGVDALWTAHSSGRQGLRRQLALVPSGGRRGPRFAEVGAALGWRETAEAPVPRLYRDFVRRAGPGRRAGFFPTLRDPEHENHPDWYDRWSSTVLALHARLREWEARS
ncbi:TIR domain-containing protein [Streptomyces sp. S.PNR 29]|uniref:TIR domain-containing protein n=1 Tax=Streptomyces sp. S.PNR 29 TaxID=2973805 RepID=UPI0025B16365|nr:TIR domain-containing protein [Streptomyces sp. S.PNR 29]MDN0199559.1 TIR domain-containing protein [Streptomyces sp. S.PNR 29]